ncbi:hypothetical protein [Thiobacillus denitrificans]|uniref:hypothetical protein n=1 Tax=Thiobacillus denitrificans TaxID=36861 RepID=UPI00035F3944|nr:hypothetical protein [Thiobacillus denitrificans]
MNTMPKPGAIHLHIDNLVLRGFTQVNEAALSAALHEALSRELCAAPALRDASLHTARASITLPAHYNAHTLGSALAQSLSGIACSGTAETHGPRHG